MGSCKPPSVFSQTFPPAPTLTETNLGSLSGKVVLITGATSGIGYELAKILYESGATVHITGRSGTKLEEALNNLKSGRPRVDGGAVQGWQLDLSDLPSIKTSAAAILASTQRLDVVFHNAGVMKPPKGSKTKLVSICRILFREKYHILTISRQGHDLEMGTNCLGPYLLNHFLEPTLQRTVASAPKDSVRVVWLSSMVAVGTVSEGMQFERDGSAPVVLDNVMQNYMQSKVGNSFLAYETAKRMGSAGVINVSAHPGFLATQLNRHAPAVQKRIMVC
jgi:retinol dehydrogenase-12